MIPFRKSYDTLSKNIKLIPIEAAFGTIFEAFFKLTNFELVIQKPLHLKVSRNNVFCIIGSQLVLL
jgi:hypothetical protein